MKWMWSTAFVVAVTTVVSAQSGKDMKTPAMADQMQATYTGCIVNVNHGASFVLTHVGDDRQAMMHHDGMMKGDSEAPNTDAPHASDDMHGDHMRSSTVVLTGRSDLKTHVGETVTVTGALSHGMSDAMPKGLDMLAVASLTVVAKSCS